jgi:hypothetical protein
MTNSLAIYDGATLIGRVELTPSGKWRALVWNDREGVSVRIGDFDARKAAIDAVTRKAGTKALEPVEGATDVHE